MVKLSHLPKTTNKVILKELETIINRNIMEEEIAGADFTEINKYLDESNQPKFKEFVSSVKPNSKQNPPFFQNIDDFDKQKRTLFHESIKKSFSFLTSETKELDGHKSIKITYCKKPHHTMLSFSLHKRNWDTMQALNKLGRALKKRIGDFFFAGTKDKRAETVQKIVAKNLTKNELANLIKNPIWNFDEINFSHLEYTNHLLKIGDLQGNRFTIALRLLDPVSQSHLTQNVENVKKTGFVNYFGLQRFGCKNLVF